MWGATDKFNPWIGLVLLLLACADGCICSPRVTPSLKAHKSLSIVMHEFGGIGGSTFQLIQMTNDRSLDIRTKRSADDVPPVFALVYIIDDGAAERLAAYLDRTGLACRGRRTTLSAIGLQDGFYTEISVSVGDATYATTDYTRTVGKSSLHSTMDNMLKIAGLRTIPGS